MILVRPANLPGHYSIRPTEKEQVELEAAAASKELTVEAFIATAIEVALDLALEG